MNEESSGGDRRAMFAIFKVRVPHREVAVEVAAVLAERGHRLVAVGSDQVRSLVVDPVPPDSGTGFWWQDFEELAVREITRARGGYLGGGTQGSSPDPLRSFRLLGLELVHELDPLVALARRREVVASYPPVIPAPPIAPCLDAEDRGQLGDPIDAVREVSLRLYGDRDAAVRTVCSGDEEAMGAYRADFARFIGDLADVMMHQDCCYPDTAWHVPLLASLAAHDDVAPGDRSLALGLLFYAATVGLRHLPSRADVLIARGEPVQETVDEQGTREAVGREVLGLLARWDRETPMAQLALAYLAAVFPAHAGVALNRMERLRDQWPGTIRAAGIDLALALARGDDAAAGAAVQWIGSWIEAGPLTAGSPLAPVRARAARLLSELLFQ